MPKVVLVTGGSRGIGAATALAAAAAGWAVVVNYRTRRDDAEQVAARIRDQGGAALAVQADVADEGDVRKMFAACMAEFGRLDGLVNNAGVLRRAGRLETFDLARWNAVFATNVTGVFLCTREAVKLMSRKHGGAGGAIVNLTSMAAVHGGADEFIDYAASKGAVDVMTIGLAHELGGDGIRVNAVRPGLILTDIHGDGGDPDRPKRLFSTVPMGRPGTPDEVAQAVLWLLSDAASYSTGTTISVSGGR